MRIYGIFALKTYIVMALAVVTFSQFVAELFSRIIPATLYGFFRDAGGAIILAVILVFAFHGFCVRDPTIDQRNMRYVDVLILKLT